MKLGFIMLAHTALHRAEQVARYWARNGAPVVIHIDARVPRRRFEAFAARLDGVENILLCDRDACEWGTWGLVAAMKTAAQTLLQAFPQVNHVCAASGSCLPLRPVQEMAAYLNAYPHTDFIESVTTADVTWTVGGIDYERFVLHFPFAWRRQRRLFDAAVTLQRKLRVRRRLPAQIVPHLGSQWWCLTRATLTALFTDPDAPTYERYFRTVWIPDESYFQTLVRLYSDRIESRSLTLSKFDFQGKPHVFYDDHLQLLRRSDCFIARKIWPNADRLYRHFLLRDGHARGPVEPNPGKIDRLFAQATIQRTRGRAGLYSQARYPRGGHENGRTAERYAVFQGFAELFPDFEGWLGRYLGSRVHGHLFGPKRAGFAGGARFWNGALSDNATLRDYDPERFLTNLIWASRGERQCFQFGPADNQAVAWPMALDTNAQISVISGAWALPLSRSSRPRDEVRAQAAALQRTEAAFLDILRSPHVKARVRIWTLADFLTAPIDHLQEVLDDSTTALPRPHLTEVPRMADLSGFGAFLQSMRNAGMQISLAGEFTVDDAPPDRAARPRPIALPR